ncbi:hypothetical protein [Ottowia sp.]|uniref:hypothetical protein n=1 Tax=Ottowia sp. TaxID=1898956 RepID=UPI0025DA1B4E|nr:hypothetical protein [Ottowia sp.]MBK6616345.1 hypothetical protein [Ottowia sp.]
MAIARSPDEQVRAEPAKVDGDGDAVERAARRGVPDALRLGHADKGPGLRYFIKRGSTTWYSVGFKSKSAASAWVDSHGDALDWRAGFVFRLRGDARDVLIVNRQGELAKV